ncbi:hypothetical protein ACWKWU_11865 [Chitinophaga lutea]
MKKLLQLFVWLVALFTLIMACSKKKAEPAEDRSNAALNIHTKAGFGYSVELPVGSALQLPAGVRFVQEPIHAYDFATCSCPAGDKSCAAGVGGLVRLCLRLRNTNDTAVTVTLPAGLVFISLSPSTQNGLLLRNEHLRLPPRSSRSVNLALLCLNPGRDASTSRDRYMPGPVTEDADVQALIALLAGKRLADERSVELVQDALWQITRGVALSPSQVEALKILE